MSTAKKRCKAKAKSTGKQCGNAPIDFGTVCRIHGGAAPQVEAAAHRRKIVELVDPALGRLHELVHNPYTDPKVLVSVIKDILDRAGYKAPTKIEGTLTMDVVQSEIERLKTTLGED